MVVVAENGIAKGTETPVAKLRTTAICSYFCHWGCFNYVGLHRWDITQQVGSSGFYVGFSAYWLVASDLSLVGAQMSLPWKSLNRDDRCLCWFSYIHGEEQYANHQCHEYSIQMKTSHKLAGYIFWRPIKKSGLRSPNTKTTGINHRHLHFQHSWGLYTAITLNVSLYLGCQSRSIHPPLQGPINFLTSL